VRLNSHENSNEFYLNNFKNNTLDIEQWGNATTWDNGNIGNYWDKYIGIDNNDDGIGDTPYIINENNQDNYPLMEPVIIPEFPSSTILLIVLVLTLIAIIIRNKIGKED
jgi:nitrous oxidase accessory protein NosD